MAEPVSDVDGESNSRFVSLDSFGEFQQAVAASQGNNLLLQYLLAQNPSPYQRPLIEDWATVTWAQLVGAKDEAEFNKLREGIDQSYSEACRQDLSTIELLKCAYPGIGLAISMVQGVKKRLGKLLNRVR